jgi:CRP/FNR family transcriptional regulator
MKADLLPLIRTRGGLHELGLSLPDWNRLAPLILTRRTIKRGEMLFAVGDASTALYEVHVGCFKTCIKVGNGHEQVTGFQLDGDFLGLDSLGAERQVSEGIALENSQVNVIHSVVLSQFVRESADFQHHFHKIMSRENERARRMMFLLGSMGAVERVANFLMDLLQRQNSRGHSPSAMNLCMTRE